MHSDAFADALHNKCSFAVMASNNDTNNTNNKQLFDTFAVRTRVGFTGVTGRQQGATLIMINAQAIKCTKEAFEGDRDMQVIQFCVVAAHAEGMVRAPFKFNDQRKGAAKPPTKPLTALSADGGMQFWTWQRKGQDKGERLDDETWTLYPGTTLKMFFREEDISKGVFGNGCVQEIPELSLCEVQFVPKSSDPCNEGWGLNVRCVSPAVLSLYSYFTSLHRLPTSAEDAKLRAIQAGDASKQMHRQIEGDSAFFVQLTASVEAYTEHVPAREVLVRKEGDPQRMQPAFVRFWNCIPGNPQCVDIPEDRLLAYTNCVTLEAALRLLEVATAVECVSLVVYTNDFRGKREGMSSFVGVPVIDTNKLLSAVAPGRAVAGEQNTFVLAAAVSQFTGAEQPLWFVVGNEEDCGCSSAVQSCSDLILCETLEQCGKGIAVSFVLGEDKTVLWRGYMNTSPVQMLCAGGGQCPARRKWSSM